MTARLGQFLETQVPIPAEPGSDARPGHGQGQDYGSIEEWEYKRHLVDDQWLACAECAICNSMLDIPNGDRALQAEE